jgi:hypothetical protein
MITLPLRPEIIGQPAAAVPCSSRATKDAHAGTIQMSAKTVKPNVGRFNYLSAIISVHLRLPTQNPHGSP